MTDIQSRHVNKPTIDNWSISHRWGDPTCAPEEGAFQLTGNVTGHDRFEDGAHVTTSLVKGKTKDGRVVTHSGSQYRLGSVDKDYAEKFEGATNRLFNALETVD